MERRQDLESAEGWRWFVGALEHVLVKAKEALKDKHVVDKPWQTHSNSGLLLMFTLLTSVRLPIWRV